MTVYMSIEEAQKVANDKNSRQKTWLYEADYNKEGEVVLNAYDKETNFFMGEI